MTFPLLMCMLLTYTPTALGARVIAASSPSKLSIATKYGGADFSIDYTKPGWQQEVLKITDGKGVDVIYDPVGMIKGACDPDSSSLFLEREGEHC